MTDATDFAGTGAELDVDLLPGEFVMVPGTYITQAQARAARSQWAAVFGLPEDYIIVTPYGYPPQPKLPPGSPEGAGRLPGAVKLEQAGWPGFWLDPVTRRRLPDEADDEYAVRLYLELVARGFYDPNTGEPRDALLAGHFDVAGDDDDARRVLAYRNGETGDDALNGLVLPAGDLARLGADWPRREASRLVAVHRSHYQEMFDAEAAMYRRRTRKAYQRLLAADPEAVIASIYPTGEALLAAAPDSPAFVDARRAFSDAVDAAVEQVRVYGNDTYQLRVLLRLEGVAGHEDPRPPEQRQAEADQQWGQAREQVESAVAGVYAAGGTADTLAAVAAALRDAVGTHLVAGQRLAAEAGPVLPPDDTVAALPAGDPDSEAG